MATLSDAFAGSVLNPQWFETDPAFYGAPVIGGGLLRASVDHGAVSIATVAALTGDVLIDVLLDFDSSNTSQTVNITIANDDGAITGYYSGSGLLEVVAGVAFTDTAMTSIAGRYVLRLAASVGSGTADAIVFPEGSPGSPVATASAALDAGSLAVMASGTAHLLVSLNDEVPQTLGVDSIDATADAITPSSPTVDTPAAYEVRITPLILGVDGALETESGGSTTVELADTTLVTQFADVEVNRAIGDPSTGRVVLSVHDATLVAGSDVPGSLVANLEPFAQALWIGYRRPGETLAEALVYGQCNVTTDYEAGTVTLDVQDPSQRCQHHYIRRGDDALNLDAARNTPEQQTRGVPALGMRFFEYGDHVDDVTTLIGFERGQECWDLISQIIRSATGPDVDISPSFDWPASYYAELDCWDSPTDPDAPGTNELGRNLDPADPDASAAGEVVFDYGLVNDNLTALTESPGRPTTHNHVVDADKAYRVTSADADSSAAVGVWVDWTETGFKVPRPTRAAPTPDLSALQALADARIKAYGVPPKFFTCTLRPDDAQARHYGHQYWDLGIANGDWYLGDYVRVRAARGYRSFSTLARITAVTFRQDGSNGLPILDVHMIPAIGGSPGVDPQDTP